MRLIVFIAFLSCACTHKQPAQPAGYKKDTVIIHDTRIKYQENNWQERFGLTHDPDEDSIWYKPVSFYLNDPDCSGLARDFYYGSLRPSDDGTTDELLKLATTDNKKLRPFYRWCLFATILIEDGGLAEHTGEPARRYAEKFPKEFHDYITNDTTNTRYEAWIGSVGYSGYYRNDDYRKPDEIRKRMTDVMLANCKDCNAQTLEWLKKFAADCFESH